MAQDDNEGVRHFIVLETQPWGRFEFANEVEFGQFVVLCRHPAFGKTRGGRLVCARCGTAELWRKEAV